MPFELQKVTQVAFTNSNPRSEFHGEDHVRAIDISQTLTGENTLLDLIESGLRAHHYCNRDAEAGQQPLNDALKHLPNLRFPKLPTRITYGTKQDKLRGYRFVIDYGLGEEGGSNVDLTDCVLAGIWYELQEGGSVTIGFSVQYNGDDLNDDRMYGRLAGLATMGEGHVQLLAPAKLLPVAKGWRSGKADTPPATDGGGTLLDGERPGDEGHEHGGDGTGNEHPEGDFAEGSPEQALLDSATKPAPETPDPFASSANDEKPKGRRVRRAA